MVNSSYTDLGKLFTGDQRPLELRTNGLSFYEIDPGTFAELIDFNNLSLDTFTTNLMGSSSPSACTGLVTWISTEPGDQPVDYGLSGGNVYVSTDGKIDLTWGLSPDPANVITYINGNVVYDVDYILEYGNISAESIQTYYLNIAYSKADCLANVSNCNVSVPTQNIYSGTCSNDITTWRGIKTTGGKHCASYLGDINVNSNVTLGNAIVWNSTDTTYYPYGNASAVQVLGSNVTYSYEFDFTAVGSDIYEGSIYSRNKFETSSSLMWISQTAAGDSIYTTNGCEAKKVVNNLGAQFTIKKGGNLKNRDIDLDRLSGQRFFLNIQTDDVYGDTDTTNEILKINFQEVLEDGANVNYIEPLNSKKEVIPVGIASGVNTIFDFPESGEYLISAHYTDSTGAVYQQSKTVFVDKDNTDDTAPLSVSARYPNFDIKQTLTRGFLGYGPHFQCTPGKYANNPRYKTIGSNFTYNGQTYNMTQNIAGCLVFNCLDNCLGINLSGDAPNGILSRGTVDNCTPEFYGTTHLSSLVMDWNSAEFTEENGVIDAEILTYPLVIPNKAASSTSTVHGTIEVSGNNTLIWISTEPGGGPNNCYGFLESYANYYSVNGQMKFYATDSNGIIERFSKSHAQLETNHTYYVNIAKVSGSVQNFTNGKPLVFLPNKDITIKFSGMWPWVYTDTQKNISAAAGINTAAPVTASNYNSQEVMPQSYAVDENYGICAETWDSGNTETVEVVIAPQSRVSMPFTTTTRMYKGNFLFTTGSKPFQSASNLKAYIVDAPEKTMASAYSKSIQSSDNSQGGVDLSLDIEVEVENYTTTTSSDAVLNKFTTYYLVLENNSNQTFTGDRLMTMVYSPAYGLPTTNYDLYPPWCINTSKMNVGGAPNGTSSGTFYPSKSFYNSDINCNFSDGDTINYYNQGQRFTIKGNDIICNAIIAQCLSENPMATAQDVLRCAGINNDSLNPDTPFYNTTNFGRLAKNADNYPNTHSPDPEGQTFTSGSGMNVYSADSQSVSALSGGATRVDQSVSDAINSGDFSEFNLNGLKNNAFTGNNENVNWQDYLSQFEKFGNYTSFSNLPLTGDSDLMPSSFRIKKRKVKNPSIYGVDIPLKDDRFVNATSQRITGGTVKQLAQPLKITPRIPRAIKTFNVRDEAYGKVIPTNINQTYRNTYYNPRSIGAYFSTKGREILNIGKTGFISDSDPSQIPGGGYKVSSGANESIPSTSPRLSRGTAKTQGGEEVFLPDSDQPIATDITYATAPEMSVTPLSVDKDGNYVPAGPPAVFKISQPTPTASVTAMAAATVAENSELYINDKKIVFKYGGSLESIKSQINCGNLGVKSIIGKDDQDRDILIISSCDSSPWTVANGCGGGIFQQVGDFHINRGFDQSKSVTSVFVPKSQLVDSNNPSATETEINIPYSDSSFASTGRLVDVNFDKIRFNDNKQYDRFTVDNSNSIMMPQETVSVSTAGKGYSVGDRLRLVGGTPVNTNKGPLTVICIESAGAGYVDPDKLTIKIGDGSTPGMAAAAKVTGLDENGGIADIEMLNYGIGYDPARPPKVTIIDNHSENSYRNITPVNGLNQFDEIRVSAEGAIIRFDYPQISEKVTTDDTVSESHIVVSQTYYRTYDPNDNTDFILGGINETNDCDIYYGGNTGDGNYPTINIEDGHIYDDVEHKKYKAVIGLPKDSSVIRGQYIRLSSTNTGANATIVNNLPDLLCSDHMIGKDGSGNDVLALNMPIVRHRDLLNSFTIDAIKAEMDTDNVTVTVAKPFLVVDDGRFLPVAPYGIPKVEAVLNPLIGVNPDKIDEDGINPIDPFVDGFSSLGGPIRVAKFLVSSVDSDGGIAGLKLMDRGLYRVFPSDLTFGIPLEYDYELQGTISSIPDNTTRKSADTLGGVDPINDNIQYGGTHPEYWNPGADNGQGAPVNPFRTSGGSSETKHPDWYQVSEYKVVDPKSGDTDTVLYYGTPGAYDPTTYVKLGKGGGLVAKDQVFDISDTGRLIKREDGIKRIPGGQGARVFLTAQDVPDCSEEGTAQQDLGLPEVVREIDGPKSFVNGANQGLIDVGYLPPDIQWTVSGEGPIANVTLNSIYPGVRFNGLDWFGLPSDDYAVGALCIQATMSSPNLTVSQQQTQLEKIYQSSDVFGVTQDTFSLANTENNLPTNVFNSTNNLNATVLSLLCIDNIQTDPNSVFGDGPNFATVRELYKYDISNIFGDAVRLEGSKQEVDAFIFQSNRFDSLEQINFSDYIDEATQKENAYVATPAKLWVDSVVLNDSKANLELRYPGFTQGGWGYFENNLMTRYQTPLVDTRYVHNSIIYDPLSGARTTDLYAWDPFKGVLPGFIDKEIDYITETDPVVYNAQRHQFGQKQIGAVWWDTSTIRYQWYEQGTNVERWKNWGKAFPGSTIIICEWVESRAKPQNYNGDGTPRWIDKYITERRWDTVKQEYTFFYYYWVTNRTTVDARLKELRNRKFDTRTLARYLSDPVGFGIHMISFLSSNSVMFSNISDVLKDSGNHVQINLARDLDPDGIKHTAWKLIREDDDNSIIPENITLKLTDSLAAENSVGEVVPDPTLSKVMSYGASFRPRQSMFADIKESRRTMAYVLNEIFANLKLYTDFPTWDSNMPVSSTWQYIERVNYYSTIYVDENTNEPVRYDDSYKPIFNVSTIADLNSLRDLPDGTVVQVAGTELAEPQLWIFNQESENFSQIAILNDTIRFKDSVYTDDTNSIMSLEIRSVLNLFNNDLFQRFNFWNVLFFEMLKYAYMEQRQLEWAFKTTYLYVEKEEQDLIQISGFKPDNYQAILDYMDEAKPYSSKIREYRDGKSPPMESIGVIQPDDGIPSDGDYDDISSGVPGIPGLPGPGEGAGDGPAGDTNPNAGMRSVSDYDKPPYPDPETGTIKILDDFNQRDREIMATNGDYINYFGVDNKANDPIRHNKINLTYDRTNWRFTEYLWNSNTTSLEQSITNNVVNLSSQTAKQVSGNANVRAIDRIFKFDPVVVGQFNLDIVNNYGIFDINISYLANAYVRRVNNVFTSTFDLYKSNKAVNAYAGWRDTDWDLQEAPYTEITTNVNVVSDIVESGNLNFTLALLKNKVGGGWQGETLDANVFTKVVPGADPTYDYQTQFGYGSQEYEQFYWDVVQEVNNYVGIFKEPPEVNLRRNDRDYDGFDGISFLRVLYGEERPEELVQVDPYETFIVNCVTNTQTAKVPIGFADQYIDPESGNTVIGHNGNIVVTSGEITQINLSNELIRRSFGTCRAVDVYAEDSYNTGSNSTFRVNLQSPPDGWPGSQSWPQISNVEITNGGVGYDANTTTVWMTVALNKNANPVQFQIFESLFGQTDYGRIRSTTMLKEDLMSWDEEIVVVDPDVAPDPLPGVPAYIWLNGSELIKYARKNSETGVLGQLQRGAEGTTIQDWKAADNIKVWDGTDASKFNNLDPRKKTWLDTGFRYEALYNFDDNNYNDNDNPGNTYIIYDESNTSMMYSESNIDVIVTEILGSNTGTGFQPGWDYGNIIAQTCNVSGIQFLEPGKARFTLDCNVPQLVNFCQIVTDFTTGELDFVIDESPLASVIVLEDPLTNTSIIAEQLAGNGNVVSNIMLVPVGNDRYTADATVRSNVFVTGTASGNISITESYVPVLEPNANITAIADISGQNVFSVANTINNMSLPTVSARVDQVWQSGIKRNFLRISGRYFTITEIDTPTLNIDTGTYLAEWFEYAQQRNNTIIIEDDLWTSETLVEGMSNTQITFNIDLTNIPWDHGRATGFPALSLADLANTDSANAYSIMKFLHGLEPPPTE